MGKDAYTETFSCLESDRARVFVSVSGEQQKNAKKMIGSLMWITANKCMGTDRLPSVNNYSSFRLKLFSVPHIRRGQYNLQLEK